MNKQIQTVTYEDGKPCDHEYCIGENPCFVCCRLNANGKYTRILETKEQTMGNFYIMWRAYGLATPIGGDWQNIKNHEENLPVQYYISESYARKELDKLKEQYPTCSFKLIKEQTNTIAERL